MSAFAKHIVWYYSSHLLIMAAAFMIIGVGLYWLYNNESKRYKWIIPFYNVYIWLRKCHLPGWMLLFIVQIYWYPAWYIEIMGVGTMMLLLYRTKGSVHNKLKRQWAFASAFCLFALFYYLGHNHLLVHASLLLFTLISLIIIKKAPKDRSLVEADVDSLFTSFWNKYKRGKTGLISMYLMLVVAFIALYSPYIASDLPIAVEQNGSIEHPSYDYIKRTANYQSDDARQIKLTDWEHMDKKLMSPIPYSPAYQDVYNRNFVGPNDRQNLTRWAVQDQPLYRHHLGTDRIGRDILSGLVHGSRTSITVGLISMGIAGLLGVLIGLISGYFGNSRFSLSRAQLGLFCFGLILSYFYAFIAFGSISPDENHYSNSMWFLLIRLVGFISIPIILVKSGRYVRVKWWSKQITIPLDSIIMKITELIYSIPALLLVIVIVGVLPEKSLSMIMVVIGAISWTGIARITRAETLKTVEMDYVESSKALGLRASTIIWRHILPNVISPVIVVLSFGMASAVLLESSLSFLGIGVPEDTVTWGSMLNAAFVSHNSDKIWLIFVPGIAIFTIVCLYNLIGEALRDALDPKT